MDARKRIIRTLLIALVIIVIGCILLKWTSSTGEEVPVHPTNRR